MKYILLFINILLLPTVSVAQWLPKNITTELQETLYTIKQDQQCFPSRGYHFPEYEFFEHASTIGYVLIQKGAGKENTTTSNVWIKDFGTLHYFKKDTTRIFLRPFLRNVKRYRIMLSVPGQVSYQSKEVYLPEDGYQIPIDEHISNWVQTTNFAAQAKIGNSDGKNYYRLQIIAEPKFLDRNMEFTLAELSITNQIEVRKTVVNDFFNGLIKSNNNQPYTRQSTGFYCDYIISGTKEETELAQKSNIFLDNIKNKEQEYSAFIDVVSRAIELYPFYEERKIRKDSLALLFANLVREYSDTNDFCTLAQKTKTFLKQEFQDPHFGISNTGMECLSENEKQAPTTRPFRLYRIKDKLFIAAIFDQRYSALLPIGAEVTKVGQYDVDILLDSLDRRKDLNNRNHDAYEFNEGLQKAITDSLLLKIKIDSSSNRTLMVKYDGHLVLPKNFVVKNGGFQTIDKDNSYLQITKWSLDVYLNFLNHWEKIRKSKKLVIDLRGNGGGTVLSVYRLLSVLIPKNSVLFSTQSKNLQLGTIALKPNPTYQINSKMQIVILCDEKTACASEIFIQSLLDNRSNVILMGTEPTAGVLANRFDVHFPSGLTLFNNSMTDKIVFPKTGSLEKKGIRPSINIKITDVKDLRPYDDLVLRTALKSK